MVINRQIFSKTCLNYFVCVLPMGNLKEFFSHSDRFKRKVNNAGLDMKRQGENISERKFDAPIGAHNMLLKVRGARKV